MPIILCMEFTEMFMSDRQRGSLLAVVLMFSLFNGGTFVF